MLQLVLHVVTICTFIEAYRAVWQAQTALAQGRVNEQVEAERLDCTAAELKLRYCFPLTEGHGDVIRSHAQPHSCGCSPEWPASKAGGCALGTGQISGRTPTCQSCNKGHLRAAQVCLPSTRHLMCLAISFMLHTTMPFEAMPCIPTLTQLTALITSPCRLLLGLACHANSQRPWTSLIPVPSGCCQMRQFVDKCLLIVCSQ